MLWLWMAACTSATVSTGPRTPGASSTVSSPLTETGSTPSRPTDPPLPTDTHSAHTGDTAGQSDTGRPADTGTPATTTTTPWIPPTYPVRAEPGPRVVCADPSARAAGPFERTALTPPTPMDEALPGSGVLVADLTGDATPEILFAGDGWIDARGWSGEACSVPPPCPSDCHGRGACAFGVCTCFAGASGAD